MTSRINLANYSYAELILIKDAVNSAIADRKADEIKVLKDKLTSVAAKAGFELSELFVGVRAVRNGAVAKYRNPRNHSQTWTGRGRRPAWLVDELKKNGGNIDPFVLRGRR